MTYVHALYAPATRRLVTVLDSHSDAVREARALRLAVVTHTAGVDTQGERYDVRYTVADRVGEVRYTAECGVSLSAALDTARNLAARHGERLVTVEISHAR